MITVMAGQTKATASRKSAENKNQKELSELIGEAMRQPGVKDVMEVFGGWSKVNDAATTYQIYQNPYPPNTVSSSSELV